LRLFLYREVEQKWFSTADAEPVTGPISIAPVIFNVRYVNGLTRIAPVAPVDSRIVVHVYGTSNRADAFAALKTAARRINMP